ncbi:hypothetical protein ONZ45_g19618 [Pleurotus djamor]|nr:hypothetical protein ONZ45_g19618 [Pleurotus djamor]
MTTSVLERCLERAKKHEDLFKEFSANLETSLKEAEQSKMPMEDIRHAKDDMQAYVTSYMTVLEDVKSDRLLYFIVSSGAIRFKAPKAPAATNTTAEEIHETVMGRKMRPHFYVMLSREIVALAMVLGMIFLLISVIMETQLSQRKQVWLACICFAGVTAVYALVPMIVAQSRRVYLPRRGGEGRSSENSLDV